MQGTFLQQALELAKIKRGFCSPNPSVGAILVDSNGIITGRGYHNGSGTPHAEIMALREQNMQANGSTMYVTLEPCCHWGKTPPCTDALIAAGIKHVVYAYVDPNPLVHRKSATILEAAGIKTEHFPLSSIDDFYESYQHWHTTKTPFVTAKLAITLNGAIAGKSGERIQITGEEINKYTHLSRKNTDAILTTVKTIIQDDPSLNARCLDQVFPKPIYILDSQLTIPVTAKIFNTAKTITLFHEEHVNRKKQQQLTDLGARCIPIEKTSKGLNLQEILVFIGQEGVHDLWVEAGGTCFASFVENKLIQRGFIYIAPFWLTEGQKAFSEDISFAESKKITWQQFGKDVLCAIRW